MLNMASTVHSQFQWDRKWNLKMFNSIKFHRIPVTFDDSGYEHIIPVKEVQMSFYMVLLSTYNKTR